MSVILQWHNFTKLKILKELILTKLINQKSVKSVIITISTMRIKSIRNFAIIHVNGVGYRFCMTKEDEVAFIKDHESDKFERINIHETSPSKEYSRCILWSVCEKEAISILNHSVLEDGGIL